jgi:predicted GIY-YIG superfamily endonuclease
MTFYVYALINPAKNEVFYVGCSAKPWQRLTAHRLNYGHITTTPALLILDRAENSQKAADLERAHITRLRSEGYPIVNSLKPSRYPSRTKKDGTKRWGAR